MRSASSTQASLAEAALAYAERGWPVLPLLRREKRPLTRKGLLDASIDPQQIIAWWTRWPMANIGLRTGVRFDVLDIDGEVGRASLDAKTGPGAAHPGPVSRTGRGEHWLYLPSGTANRAGLMEKVDWRGTNGYIVAPPSIHPDGHAYEWDTSNGPDTPLPEVPDWLSPMLVEWHERNPHEDSILVLRTHAFSKNSPERLLTASPLKVEAALTDIVQMARELGYQPRPDGGNRYAIVCPFHEGDRDPSMKLYVHDNSFYCYGCQAWGDALNLRDGRPGGKRV